jgi:hypothetical protein
MTDTEILPRQHLAPRRTDERPCKLLEWKPWPLSNPSLVGHATIAFAGGWTIHAIPIFRRADGSLSAGVPNAAQLDAEGHVRLKDGKRQYTAVVTFETADGRERWQRLVQGALAAGGITGAPETQP